MYPFSQVTDFWKQRHRCLIKDSTESNDAVMVKDKQRRYVLHNGTALTLNHN